MIARYTVLIPTEDELRQPLQLAAAAHQYITDGHIKYESANVQHGKPYDSLVVYAEESPETDSKIKHLSLYLAEVANVHEIVANKDGKNNKSWRLYNQNYQKGQGADLSALLHKIPFTDI